jgi:hypothetical protein
MFRDDEHFTAMPMIANSNVSYRLFALPDRPEREAVRPGPETQSGPERATKRMVETPPEGHEWDELLGHGTLTQLDKFSIEWGSSKK